ncbi:uncharacterized protein (TIGR02246 family) [Kribbella sp. VKM Ac-2527]|uniref:Uncharacterized protein (TIGR02246 family) n=1 Tax=Kribbella caucasensis TaxID=2512215 RepID=A0A4R6KLU4_9ACTN|nr:SgcJ/EcaC family oxidoreductase [Kribbella sp. VKM Ac-2527]TDO52171.1 uncharacterized protein (TIGR02246 family) [Kribbella sp. VKM Ac-2527]
MEITGQIPSQEDVDAILDLVAKVEQAQRTEDVDAFIALFRKDALWVTGHGKRLYGRDIIEEFTRRVLPGATKDATVTYIPDHLLFVRPDVAVVNVNQTYLPTNPTLPVDNGSPVYLLAKDTTTWQIAAAQNTIVVKDA